MVRRTARRSYLRVMGIVFVGRHVYRLVTRVVTVIIAGFFFRNFFSHLILFNLFRSSYAITKHAVCVCVCGGARGTFWVIIWGARIIWHCRRFHRRDIASNTFIKHRLCLNRALYCTRTRTRVRAYVYIIHTPYARAIGFFRVTIRQSEDV